VRARGAAAARSRVRTCVPRARLGAAPLRVAFGRPGASAALCSVLQSKCGRKRIPEVGSVCSQLTNRPIDINFFQCQKLRTNRFSRTKPGKGIKAKPPGPPAVRNQPETRTLDKARSQKARAAEGGAGGGPRGGRPEGQSRPSARRLRVRGVHGPLPGGRRRPDVGRGRAPGRGRGRGGG